MFLHVNSFLKNIFKKILPITFLYIPFISLFIFVLFFFIFYFCFCLSFFFLRKRKTRKHRSFVVGTRGSLSPLLPPQKPQTRNRKIRNTEEQRQNLYFLKIMVRKRKTKREAKSEKKRQKTHKKFSKEDTFIKREKRRKFQEAHKTKQ